jgi:hypothetical protein
MTLVFESKLQQAEFVQPNGKRVSGSARCLARIVQASESDEPASCVRVRDWRSGDQFRDGAIRHAPPDALHTDAAIIPEDVIRSLPEDALLALTWEFIPGRPT